MSGEELGMLTFSGALTSNVTTKTTVPPSVHQRLNVLSPPTAFVPNVLTIPERMFTPQAKAAICTRVMGRPSESSMIEAR